MPAVVCVWVLFPGGSSELYLAQPDHQLHLGSTPALKSQT